MKYFSIEDIFNKNHHFILSMFSILLIAYIVEIFYLYNEFKNICDDITEESEYDPSAWINSDSLNFSIYKFVWPNVIILIIFIVVLIVYFCQNFSKNNIYNATCFICKMIESFLTTYFFTFVLTIPLITVIGYVYKNLDLSGDIMHNEASLMTSSLIAFIFIYALVKAFNMLVNYKIKLN